MTDEMFDRFVEKTIENFGDSYIDTSLLSYEPHEFSARFERKMRKLIKKQRRFYFPLVKTPLRLSFTVIAMVILMTVTTMMSVGAVREAIFNFFINTFSTHSDINAIDDDQHPDTIEDIYEITYDLSGYEVNFESYLERQRIISYLKNGKEIIFEQHVNDAFNVRANTEGAEIFHVDLNGYDAMYYYNNLDYHNLIWDNGKYTFWLLSNISKEEFFEIAKSVRKSE